MTETYKKEIDKICQETHKLLGKTIKNTLNSDKRAIANGASWYERHRLHFLLEEANIGRKTIDDNQLYSPWYLIELKSINHAVKKWRKKQIWKDIEPSLVDKDSFMHTIGKLFLAGGFEKQGYKIQLIQKSEGATPDLRIQAKGGTQDWLFVECYQPNIFSGKPRIILDRNIRKIINRSMDKAKRQLSSSNQGVIVIMGYSQMNYNWEKLKEHIVKRLDITNRPYLAGFFTCNITTLIKNIRGRLSFKMVIACNYISNPSYFGRINIEERAHEEQYVEVDTTYWIGKKLSEIEFPHSAIKKKNEIERRVFTVILNMYDEADPKKDTIITTKKDDILLFQGQSNQNYVCANCGKLLAKRAWNHSLNNIVIKCPVCEKKLLVPKKELPKYSLLGKIGIEAGTYNFETSVYLRRGISIIGGVHTRIVRGRAKKDAKETNRGPKLLE